MKRLFLILMATCSTALMMPVDVEAKRMGGGRNIGTPRDAVTQRQATPPTQAQPAQPAAPASAAAPKATPTPASPAVQQPAWKRWMGPIAGIAAGLGIAALMSHLGLSEAFGNFLMIALLVLAVMVIVGLILRRRAKPAEGMQYRGTELAGAGPSGSAPPPMFGGAGAAAEPVRAMTDRPGKPYPEGFDADTFVRGAKANFIQLQRAYDEGDVSTLRDVMTPEMYAEVSKDLASRGVHHETEVVTLNAEVLEVVEEKDTYWASVRFTGLLREDNKPTPEAFDEVWNLTKPVSGETGWLLAGIQQLQ